MPFWFREFSGQFNASVFMAGGIAAGVAGIMKPGSQYQGEAVVVAEFVIVGQGLAGRHHFLCVEKCMELNTFTKFVLKKVCHQRLCVLMSCTYCPLCHKDNYC